MTDFTYRCLDLIADLDTRFTAMPKLWKDHVKNTESPYIAESFTDLVQAFLTEGLLDIGNSIGLESFRGLISKLDDTDYSTIKTLRELGLIDNKLNASITSYFAGRRKLLPEDRAWIRFTDLIDLEMDNAC